MTMALYLDGQYLVDAATTSGWGDFCRWAETTDGDTIKAFANEGHTEDMSALLVELRAAKPSEDESTADVVQGIVKALEDQDDGLVVVSDGFGDIDGSRARL